MGVDQGTTADPTDQRHGLFLAQALRQPRQPPRLQLAMQHQAQSRFPPQGFAGAAMPPQGIGGLAAVAASQAEAEAAARARAAEQMAFEDAWKASNPDLRTPFASVEDAVSRLLPYHVFAEYEDDEDGVDVGGATVTEKSSSQKCEDGMNATMEGFLADFEKQVLSFNVMTRRREEGFSRSEELLLLEMALYEDERRQTERVRAAFAQHQQEQREQQEAMRARQALAQAQAAGAWPLAQPAAAWQALASAKRGERGSCGQALGPAAVMQQQQQQEIMTTDTWQAIAAAASRGEGEPSGKALVQAVMMQQQQLEMIAAAASRGAGGPGGQALTPAVVMQLLQQQQQQEMMEADAWQLGGRQRYVAPHGDGSSSGQARPPPAVPAQGQGTGAAAGMAPPWRRRAESREQ
ncbi:uncharacterized protein LOC133923469 [Phragmites australis]|uniref:uncharacterized protein LOC133923469 n=1 Tax=Phragmites australis TaxID=29695 RepID=UPI002D78A842|nr:uncharacterized protein LOC133923469 [Phragmites australis]